MNNQNLSNTLFRKIVGVGTKKLHEDLALRILKKRHLEYLRIKSKEIKKKPLIIGDNNYSRRQQHQISNKETITIIQ